ncbi:MAG: undecaprenyl/decaprenyl-phosphate alpha-N-acetylglucosaminyl 1-phosphate transferase [Bacteroidales bacterium]|nr:undecaprenyl/decaprenyl-phosphate alpha-N-acetylglucosaminyl 1-phosphate transferase [Bacteroidales bacterium]
MSVSTIVLLSDFAGGFLIGTMLILLLLKVSYKNKIFDVPDARKIHHLPIPRLGGMAFLPSVTVVTAVTLVILYQQDFIYPGFLGSRGFIHMSCMSAGAFLVYMIGIADDLSGVDYKLKFLVQFAAAGIICASGLWMSTLYGLYFVNRMSVFVGIPFTILLVAYITNALNMIDGVDGLASGFSLVFLGCMSVIFITEHRLLLSMISVTTFSTVLAFWFFNVFGSQEKSTKLFMGDTGSLTLGMIMSYLIISITTLAPYNGPTRNCKYLIIAFSALMLPMLDVLRLIVFRLKNHKSPFKPDMNHIHHKFLQLGFSQKQTLFILLAIDVVLIGLNAGLSMLMNVNLLFLLDVAIYYVLVRVLTHKILQKENAAKVVQGR